MSLPLLTLEAGAQGRFSWHRFELDPLDGGEVLLHDRLATQTHLVDGLMKTLFDMLLLHPEGLTTRQMHDIENEFTESESTVRTVLMQMQTLGMVPGSLDISAQFDFPPFASGNTAAP